MAVSRTLGDPTRTEMKVSGSTGSPPATTVPGDATDKATASNEDGTKRGRRNKTHLKVEYGPLALAVQSLTRGMRRAGSENLALL